MKIGTEMETSASTGVAHTRSIKYFIILKRRE
jgi:hypothetical protein